MKVCTKCLIEKELSEFSKQKNHKDGLRPRCRDCHNADNRKYVSDNKEAISKRRKEQYYADVEKSREQCLKSYYKHHNARKKSSAINAKKHWAGKTADEKFEHGLKHRKRQLLWKKNNSQSTSYHTANRRSAILKATPPWLTKEQREEIAGFYKTAKTMSKFHEIKYEVDHIEPLNGKKSRGLHVPWNLAVIPATDNRKKSNKIIL